MIWRDAVEAARPRPAIRRDAQGRTWLCYLDGSLDRVDARGRVRRMPRTQAGAWTDWAPEEAP